MKIVDDFLAEVRSSPQFTAALAADPKWEQELLAIENGLIAVDKQADDDALMLEALDKIQVVVGQSDLPIKHRLTEVVRLLYRLRDAGRNVH